MNNIKKLSIFLTLILIAGIFIVIGLFKYNNDLNNSFYINENILQDLNFLKQREHKLNYLILRSTFYIYENNDKVAKEIQLIEKTINNLQNNLFFKQNYSIAYNDFLKYKKIFERKKNNIYRFYTYNSLIKNSLIYLNKILFDSVSLFLEDKTYFKNMVEVISDVLITKNTFDEQFIKNLRISYFKKKKFEDEKKQMINNVFIGNLMLFKNNFHNYSLYLDNINRSNSLEQLQKVFDNFFIEREQNINSLELVFYFIIFVIIGGIVLIYALLMIINKKHSELKKTFTIDKLTKLGNRAKFHIDIKKYSFPVLHIINIDKFKHFNDIYGNEIGDKILKQVAKILKNNFNCKKKRVYRLGGDDFAILCENKLACEDIIDYFKNHPIVIDEKEFNIRVSIGISRELPLIETADMAIKKVKKDSKIKILEYDKNSNLKNEYEENLKKSKVLETAIKNNQIIPVFQPIYSNNDLKIIKYEVLGRIKENGKLISIFPFLNIAKENKVYIEITKSIYKKTYEIFKDNDLEFSLNLSIDDIIEEEIIDLLEKLFIDTNFAKRCTFELLESEAIEDYDKVKSFIEKMKKKGIKFAIDDFGSGYSNFEHILNLKIDYLKIDGSLIKNIEDKKTKIIVETINEFAKKIELNTIAEFIENEKIFKTVKEIGIDFSQGYYLSPPLENIIDN
ncbi:EAL domain-containing protein [Hydrogenimonas thermophila]|uniref:EAL domain-containing protein n=1 Tax=Hydrogenimonas thermophila TaxID=223786 RepID=UPI0029370F50|nr:EAL domain-containing protein [Hydrogenimonas thermophila]WOE69821.1 EAL domain-containing protein [Hydrogenimonas thermophila]WOE72336.1 EAL domain-containing protein [Hydrogenimonas thermophila]